MQTGRQDRAKRVISIPHHIYEDFKDVNIENEKFFEFVTANIMVQFLEKMNEEVQMQDAALRWVVAFPHCIPSQGRSIIHEVATYFGLASHSEGGKKRRALIYPRSLYKEKQDQERRKIERDLEKIREKNGGKVMIGIQYDNPRTMRDKMFKLCLEENRTIKDKAVIDDLCMQIFGDTEKIPLTFVGYKEYVQPLLEKKKAELDQSEFAKMAQ